MAGIASMYCCLNHEQAAYLVQTPSHMYTAVQIQYKFGSSVGQPTPCKTQHIYCWQSGRE